MKYLEQLYMMPNDKKLYNPKKKEIQNEISSIFPNAEHHDSGRQTHVYRH